MSNETKRTSLLFLLGAVISLVLLSGSLSNLELHPGSPLPAIETGYAAPQDVLQPGLAFSFTALTGIVALILLLVIIYVLLSLIAYVKLKRLLLWLVRFIVALAALFVVLLILFFLKLAPSGDSGWALEIPPFSSAGIPTAPLGRPPNLFLWLVVAGFVLGIGFFVLRVFRQKAELSSAEDLLLQQAKDAMEALRAGRDFKNVIINCYLEMTNTLREAHGIERENDATVREFQTWLESKGWPSVPVQQLTGLFEKVRYGKQYLSENDEKIALDSLGELIQFAERTKDEIPAE